MKSVLILGLDSFGIQVAKEIRERGHQVMAVDKNEDRVNAALPFVNDAMIGDSTNQEFLMSLGVNNFDVCIVAIDEDFQSSLETTALLKELGAKFVVSKTYREVQAKFLLRNGADEIVNPEKQMATWTAIRYTSDHVLDYIKLDDEHSIFEVNIPSDWVGKTIGNIDIRKKYGINILATKENGSMNLAIGPDVVLKAGMTLLVIGDYKALQKCFKIN